MTRHAHSFYLGACDNPRCRALHFRLLDEHGQVFASMAMGIEDVPDIIEAMRNCAYEIVASKEGSDHG